jgi:hypothetical protein
MHGMKPEGEGSLQSSVRERQRERRAVAAEEGGT